LEKYDFTDYYKQAYLKEKSRNIQLALEAASEEQSVLELRQKYERIAKNPVVRLFNKIEGFPEKIKEERDVLLKDTVCGESSVSVRQYEKNLFFQKNPYQYWIGEHENAVRTDRTADVIRENMMEKYSITENESKTEVVFMEDCKGTFSMENIEKPYLLFVPRQGRLGAEALRLVDNYFDKNPKVSMLYGCEDCVRKSKKGEEVRKDPWFKPAYSPETLLSFFYFGNVFAVRKERFADVKWLKSDRFRENIYDFVLKAEESLGERAKEEIVLLEEILFHKIQNETEITIDKTIDETAIDGIWGYEREYERVKLEALGRRGYQGYLEEGNVPGVYNVCYDTKGKVSVIILSKDHPEILETCIRSIREKTDYPDYEIIVVDNGSYETNRIKSEELSRKYDFQFICEPMDFNFSAMCNLGAKAASGEYLLLLNDDIEVIESGYMKRMAGQAAVSGVGAVGAKLWYPDSLTIQHAGITNLAIGPAHKLVPFSDDKRYYDGRNIFTFNFLAVTAACMMVRRELYDKMGGMDETMPVAYNDVAFCFKLHREGYRNVLRNDAVLLHHESLSRGLDEEDKEKAGRLLGERKELYRKYPEYEGYDPYYSPRLIQDSPEYRFGSSFEYQRDEVRKPITEWGLKKEAKDEKGLKGAKSLKNAAELKEKQLDISIDEVCVLKGSGEMPAESMTMKSNSGVMKITGWSVLRNADNCHYKRSLLLEETEGKKLYRTEIMSYLREDVTRLYRAGAVLSNKQDSDGEKRIELSGLVARFELKAVKRGNYRIGILYEDMLSDKMYYRMTERTIEV